jgi:glycosyltransferase involved in cell wall biosynthesis
MLFGYPHPNLVKLGHGPGREARRSGYRRAVARILLYTAVAATGGAEVALSNLVASLAGGHEVHVGGASRAVVDAVAGAAGGVARHVADGGPAGCAGLLRRVRPDLLQVNLEVPWGGAAMLAAGLARPRLRVVAVQHMAVRTTRLPTWLRTRALALRLDAHVAVSADAARRVEDFYTLGRGSVRVIHNGVPAEAPATRARGEDRLLVGSVGRLDRVKGHDVLLRALAKLPEADGMIVGAGADRAELLGLAAELGLAERVRLPGATDRVADTLAGFDVYCQPSRYEGLGLALIEAMLAGLPCVASRVGGIPEVLGDCGLLVPPDDPDALADALAVLAADPGLRASLGARARRRARAAFGVARMAAAYEELWARVLAAPRSPRLRVPAPKP